MFGHDAGKIARATAAIRNAKYSACDTVSAAMRERRKMINAITAATNPPRLPLAISPAADSIARIRPALECTRFLPPSIKPSAAKSPGNKNPASAFASANGHPARNVSSPWAKNCTNSCSRIPAANNAYPAAAIAEKPYLFARQQGAAK
jgi:hypothetical protein